MTSGATAYRQNSIDTATPGQLVVMLYDGVVTALGKAETALEAKRLDGAHEEFTRAQAIIMELLSTLDMSAGDVAHSLASLYEYSHHQLVKANVEKRFAPAEPVRVIFADLRQAWASIVAGVE
jgi:flagellar protein FliS